MAAGPDAGSWPESASRTTNPPAAVAPMCAACWGGGGWLPETDGPSDSPGLAPTGAGAWDGRATAMRAMANTATNPPARAEVYFRPRGYCAGMRGRWKSPCRDAGGYRGRIEERPPGAGAGQPLEVYGRGQHAPGGGPVKGRSKSNRPGQNFPIRAPGRTGRSPPTGWSMPDHSPGRSRPRPGRESRRRNNPFAHNSVAAGHLGARDPPAASHPAQAML